MYGQKDEHLHRQVSRQTKRLLDCDEIAARGGAVCLLHPISEVQLRGWKSARHRGQPNCFYSCTAAGDQCDTTCTASYRLPALALQNGRGDMGPVLYSANMCSRHATGTRCLSTNACVPAACCEVQTAEKESKGSRGSDSTLTTA